jgi:hypothetical protein
MMTAPGKGAERLAEIFREIFALSETNPSKSAAPDDSVESFDTQDASGTSETCAPKGSEQWIEERQAPRR